MSNQWGRNTQGERGGSSGYLLAAILCLLLIGAGVYGWFARASLQAEVARLTEGTADLAAKLSDAETARQKTAEDMEALKRNSGQWAGELEQDYANLQLNEVPKLNRLLDKRDATIAALEKQLDALKVAAKEKAALETALQSAREEAAANADTARKLTGDIAALHGDIEGLRAKASDLETARSRIESLLLAAETQAATAKSTLATLQNKRLPDLENALAAEKAKTAALERELATRPGTQTSGEMPQSASPDARTEGTEQQSGRAPRDRAAVATLLAGLPGLGRLDDSGRRQLQDALASGACVTDALESVFDKVPLIVMRNLMRELKSDC